MKKQFFLFSTLALASSLSFAQGVPHVFSSGERALASEVNENFQSVIDLIDATTLSIATNTSNVANNTTTIASNTSSISTLESTVAALPDNSAQVTANTTAITSLQTTISGLPNNSAQVSANTAAIAANDTDIAALQAQPDNSAQVATNTTAITTNAADILDNSADISANDTDISGLTSRVTTLESTTVTDLDQRVTAVESNVRPTSDYEGFSTPFSTTGQPRNIVILRRDNGSGSVYYNVRSRYQNDTGETISINGTDQTFEYLAVYGNVNVDGSNTLTSQPNRYIEAMDDVNYRNYSTATKFYDTATLAEASVSDISSDIVDIHSNEGNVNHIRRYTTAYDIGAATTTNTSQLRQRTYTIGTGYQANGIDFGQTPFRVEHRTVNSITSSRIRIQGIGVVELFAASAPGTPTQVVYYNVDGQTGGSLAGTPFTVGSALHTLFFLN